jgi:hypothetical protein
MSPADAANDPLVSVRRHPHDYQTAQVRLSKLRGFRLDRVSGGVNRATAHPTVFAYMWCDTIESGELGHSCAHGPGPHNIKVAIPKVCNDRALYRTIRALAEGGSR